MTLELNALILATALLLALAIDHYLGEPATRWHPVVWMGNYLGWAGRRVAPVTGSVQPDYKAFSLAALMWCAGAAIIYIATWSLQTSLMQLPVVLGPVAGGLLAALLLSLALKPMLAWAMLRREALAVEVALTESLPAGRERLRWLVSRDVTQLTEAQVRESAIETLAENLNDSVVAPIFWFVLLGLPGAALYRFANTADAMWGYPGQYQGRYWAWAGKWAARADDVLSWIPARITAVLLAAVAGGLSMAQLRREARRTPSPNSGWPMASMALALGVSLHKPGVYGLNDDGLEPQALDLPRAVAYASKTLLALVVIAQAAIYLIATGRAA